MTTPRLLVVIGTYTRDWVCEETTTGQCIFLKNGPTWPLFVYFQSSLVKPYTILQQINVENVHPGYGA